MSQTLRYWINDEEVVREIADANDEVIPGVRWGEPWALFTPAYWLSQFWMNGLDSVEFSPYHTRGSLADEVAFCLLGGYGITAEQASTAFEVCCDANLVRRLEIDPAEWSEVLQRPMMVNGRQQRYRFPNQKARFLAAAMVYLRANPLDEVSGRELRDALLNVEGIGPKTAGWIARNYADADEVAILDIHLVRAGVLCGIFGPEQRVERNYHAMETRFLEFCQAIGARPAVLDCLIWDQMRALGSVALDAVRGTASSKITHKAKSRRQGRNERQLGLL